MFTNLSVCVPNREESLGEDLGLVDSPAYSGSCLSKPRAQCGAMHGSRTPQLTNRERTRLLTPQVARPSLVHLNFGFLHLTSLRDTMTVMATRFTPEVLLSAPRRSPGVPSPSGKRALYSVSTYSFEDHKKTSQVRVLDIESGDSISLVEDAKASEPVWLGDDEILHLKSDDNGTTTLVVRSVTSTEQE